MRDGQIMGTVNAAEQKLTQNDHILHQTITLNRTRLDAIEKVMFGSRTRFFMILVGMVINPKWVRDMVAEFHAEQIKEYNVAVKEAQAKAAKANKIIKVKNPEPVVLRQV